VGQLPPRGSINTEWDGAVATARNHPNEAVEVAQNISVVRINSVRQYVVRPPYSTPEGHIVVTCRGSKADDEGKRRGNMYFTWVPNDKRKK
jgi:hypothetical protein